MCIGVQDPNSARGPPGFRSVEVIPTQLFPLENGVLNTPHPTGFAPVGPNERMQMYHTIQADLNANQNRILSALHVLAFAAEIYFQPGADGKPVGRRLLREHPRCLGKAKPC